MVGLLLNMLSIIVGVFFFWSMLSSVILLIILFWYVFISSWFDVNFFRNVLFIIWYVGYLLFLIKGMWSEIILYFVICVKFINDWLLCFFLLDFVSVCCSGGLYR